MCIQSESDRMMGWSYVIFQERLANLPIMITHAYIIIKVNDICKQLILIYIICTQNCSLFILYLYVPVYIPLFFFCHSNLLIMSEKLLKISLTIKVNKGREWKYTYPLMITPQWRRKQIERRGGVDLSDILTSKKKVFGRLCIKFQQQKTPPQPLTRFRRLCTNMD